MNDQIRRNLALFPIGIVQKLTDLTARQIRYYEQHQLVYPARTEGNQRLYSFNDVERLLEVKKLIEQGLNIAGIKTVLGTAKTASELLPISEKEQAKMVKEVKRDLSDRELRDLLKKEILHTHKPGLKGMQHNSFNAGDLSRFFH
ncbi:MerR family transcriptional regulator [Tumebacillus permanentifrigoris]|uniref:Transcriptional regulator n=1 Tax=Tumebacillus permanentifrigoris TaxID=378543 RepID=A0A316DEK8_9BACL|nr:MerR family transcriptional regulator [Tumebacillus permanentifrigoris]PWK15619.1 transcriptional regulator [Tumebacillus permanentifrigoris]